MDPLDSPHLADKRFTFVEMTDVFSLAWQVSDLASGSITIRQKLLKRKLLHAIIQANNCGNGEKNNKFYLSGKKPYSGKFICYPQS